MKTRIWMNPVFMLLMMLVFPAGAQEKNKKEDVFVIVDSMPEYPGGEEALKTWLSENIRYPEEAKNSSIQGIVYVTFVIDKQGKVTDSKLERGASPALDKEALRVIGIMPDWKPGKHKGSEVKVSCTIPISFKLE